ncbi:hypothetical protein SAMN02746095_02965 [Acidocella aminolytica 101 = DSM 11237]|nr:hypothetical protein [Acidocella aminolytica]GBQ31990.1 hypothetical protein AA11237_0035 [Acidocella aminolytica 101 = DSM 11237]SHF35969.1 hypothetical protein SAMN02746095_02965 [Acidocella aminolytica 101 = DSM 11237]
MPASYIWHLPYGGGLPAFVGRPTNAEAIEAVIREQLALEAGVSENPAPTITVDAEPNGQTYATIRYVDAATGQTETLSMPVGQ